MPSVTIRCIEATRNKHPAYTVPYWDICADKPGPCVLVTAAMHGNEVQGAEVIRRFLPLASRQLICGRCLLFPIVNRMAVAQRQPHIDYDPAKYYGSDPVNNLNGSWPGSPDGSDTQRLAYAIFNSEPVKNADILIDLHCWNKTYATTALTQAKSEKARKLAEASGIRFAKHSTWKPEKPGQVGILSQYFVYSSGRAALCVEFAGQYGWWPREILIGERAMRNWFRLLKMLPGELEGQEEKVIWLNDAKHETITAPHNGLFMPAGKHLSDPVVKGELLGYLLDDERLVQTEIRAPSNGYLYQYGTVRGMDKRWTAPDQQTTLHPYTSQGETVAAIVSP